MERKNEFPPISFAVAAAIHSHLHSGLVANAATAGQTEPSSQQIADLAYRIWEAEGHPDGREREHWTQAEARLRALFAHIQSLRESTAW
jgi:hypothetical protein